MEVSGSEERGFVYVSGATIARPGWAGYWHILVPVWAGAIVGKSQTGFINVCHISSGPLKLSSCFWRARIRTFPGFQFRPARSAPSGTAAANQEPLGSRSPKQIDNRSSEDVRALRSKECVR